MPYFYKPNFRKVCGSIPVVGQWVSNVAFAIKAKNMNKWDRGFLCVPLISNCVSAYTGAWAAYKSNSGPAVVAGRMVVGFTMGFLFGIDNGIDFATETYGQNALGGKGSFSNFLLHARQMQVEESNEVANDASAESIVSVAPTRDASTSSSSRIDGGSFFSAKRRVRQTIQPRGDETSPGLSNYIST